jgi:hypothetical protein
MPTTRRLNAPFIVILGLVMAMVAFAGPANATPYTHQPTISVSTQTPRMGGHFRLCGRGFHARGIVKITLDRRIFLGSLRTNSSGAFCATVRLPARVSGGHRLWVADQYRHSASAWIRIVRPGVRVAGVSVTAGTTTSDATTTSETTTSGATTSTGELAFTGAAVVGIGALGGLLLVGGGLMLFAGKRRKTTS